MTIALPLPPRAESPARGTRARSSAPAAPGAFSRTNLGSLPAGQIVALLILHGGPQGAVAGLVRQVVPRGRATPTMEDYLAIITRGFADMSGGLHLTPAGTCAAGALVRMIQAA